MLSEAVPLSLIRYQGPMLRAWGRALARSWLPFSRPETNPETFRDLVAIVAPPAPELVNAYARWSGGHYEGTLPPHMFAQWGLHLALQVIEQSKYNLVDIINQGVNMRCYGEISSYMPLVVRASLVSVQEHDGRADMAVRIVTGNKDCHQLVEATLFTTFLSPSARRSVLRSPRQQALSWSTVNQWQAEPHDGFQFAVLTGDFNPIHWVDRIGRKSPFGRTVLQGLGMFARTYEGLQRDQTIRELDLRFLRPVPLPSGVLTVETGRGGSGEQLVRVCDGGGRVRAAGHFA